MRTIFGIFISLILFSSVQLKANVIEKADSAYMSDNFTEALELYMNALENGTSSQLYYNIGNTYYRLNELGNAVLYYKKALKLDPSNTDAKLNLEFVTTKLIDKIETNDSWTKRISERIIFLTTPNGWAIASIIFFAIFLLLLGYYLLSDKIYIRKFSFFGAIAIIIITAICSYIAFHTADIFSKEKEAVIISPVIQLSTVPRLPQDKSEQAFTLHEGALVEIIDSLNVPTDSINPKWFEIKVNNRHRAWIPANSLSKI